MRESSSATRWKDGAWTPPIAKVSGLKDVHKKKKKTREKRKEKRQKDKKTKKTKRKKEKGKRKKEKGKRKKNEKRKTSRKGVPPETGQKKS